MRRSPISLAAILVVAARLRFWGCRGHPVRIGVDEPEVIDRAVRMMKTGDFNPHFFDYPAFYMYVQLAVAIFRFMLGAMAGQWKALGEVRRPSSTSGAEP